MLRYELLRERGVLVLEPEGALRAEDFAALALPSMRTSSTAASLRGC